ncbi:MAG: hypothetical protein AB7L41_05675 [Flavobacteriaceae bacterium]
MRTNLLITVSTIAMLGSAFALPASADDMNNANVRGKGDAELKVEDTMQPTGAGIDTTAEAKNTDNIMGQGEGEADVSTSMQLTGAGVDTQAEAENDLNKRGKGDAELKAEGEANLDKQSMTLDAQTGEQLAAGEAPGTDDVNKRGAGLSEGTAPASGSSTVEATGSTSTMEEDQNTFTENNINKNNAGPGDTDTAEGTPLPSGSAGVTQQGTASTTEENANTFTEENVNKRGTGPGAS